MDVRSYAARSEAVAHHFVAALRPYVMSRMVGHRVDPDEIATALGAAEARLEEAFAAWAAAPPSEQRASPLELFREALAAPTEALLALSIEPVERDDAAVRTLPGDLYDLAPVTSRELGEDAWQAHVAWGIARAEAVGGVVPRPSRPVAGARVVLVSTNLMDRTRITDESLQSGVGVEVWRNPAAVAEGLTRGVPAFAMVDLEHAAANEVIRELHDAGATVVAYGPHVDDLAMAAARSLGADDVLPRSVFFKRLPKMLPTPL